MNGEAGSRTIPPELQAKFLKLREVYAAKLPGKLDQLERALHAAFAENAAAEPVGQARMLAHRLRGTAGSYGFAALSRLAGELEDLLLAHDTSAASSSCREAAAELLPRLRIAAASPDPVVVAPANPPAGDTTR